MGKIRVNGTGSAIADYLFSGVDFNGPAFSALCSTRPGDGGLEPGLLVLTEDFERFTGKKILQALAGIIGGRKPDSFNLGGPAVVALINAAQLSDPASTAFSFYSSGGSDDAAERLRAILEETPLELDKYKKVDVESPFTYVLSDPDFNEGSGERTFVNNIGSAWRVLSQDLNESFFDGDIVLFGGTALVPNIHSDLTDLVKTGKDSGCVTIVTTVYDFPNERKRPGQPWPLGRDESTYNHVDLLISDCEEAIRLSGGNSLPEAADILIDRGLSALVVTNGTKDVFCYSSGALFEEVKVYLPVSDAVERARERTIIKGDTTGCGDNFAGGIIFSMVSQLQEGRPVLDLADACSWGIASGDFACFYLGGTFQESYPGEKREKVQRIYSRHLENRS